MINWIRDLLFNEKEWREIEAMSDDDLRWEFCKMLEDSQQGHYQTQRFRRVCYQMASRFEKLA